MLAVLAPAPAGAQTEPRLPRRTSGAARACRQHRSDQGRRRVPLRRRRVRRRRARRCRRTTRTSSRPRPRPLGQAQVQQGIVFVVDTSASTDADGDARREQERHQGAGRQAARRTCRSRSSRPASDALVMQRVHHRPRRRSTTRLTLAHAAGRRRACGRASCAARRSSADVPAMVGSMVLVTDGNTGTGTPFADAKGAVMHAASTVDSFGVAGGSSAAKPTTLADDHGGVYQETNKASDLTGSHDVGRSAALGALPLRLPVGRRPRVSTTSPSPSATPPTRGSYVVGSDARGASALAYQAPPKSGGVARRSRTTSASRSPSCLGLLAVVLGAYAIISLLVKDDTGLEGMLQPYSEDTVRRAPTTTGRVERAGHGADRASCNARSSSPRQFAENRGFLDPGRGRARAGQPAAACRRGDVLLRRGVPSSCRCWRWCSPRNVLVFLIVLGIAVLLPPAAVELPGRASAGGSSRRCCPTRCSCSSGTLRAGYSLMQGVEAVSQEVAEPMGRELRRVVTEARLGRPLEESLDGRRRAHGQRGLRLGRHGHPHPARGRRQPVRAAHDRGRDDDRSASACAVTSKALTAEGRIERHRARHRCPSASAS